MKCNKCNQENPTDAKFCSACGNALAQENSNQSTPTFTTTAEATPTPITTTPISSGFNNLNAPAQAKKNPAHIIMAIECIAGIALVIVVVGLLLWSFLGKSSDESDGKSSSKSSSESTLSCEKETKAVSTSIFLTYKKDEISKLEMLYIIDQTIDSDSLRGTDAEDYMAVGFLNIALSQHDGEDGITYSYSEGKALTTISFVAELAKMKKSSANELLEDFADSGATMEQAKKSLSSEGYTCTVK